MSLKRKKEKKKMLCYLEQTYLLLEHRHILIIKFLIVLFHPLPIEMLNAKRI